MNSRLSLFIPLFISLLFGACSLSPALEETDTEIIKFDGSWQSENGNLSSNLRKELQSRTLQIYHDFSYSLKDTDRQANVSLSKGVFDFKESVDGIFPVTIYQTYPNTVTYQGIVEINMDVEPAEMTLEYVQTFPDQELALSPPLAEEGFGSTHNFGLGIQNVQKFSVQ